MKHATDPCALASKKLHKRMAVPCSIKNIGETCFFLSVQLRFCHCAWGTRRLRRHVEFKKHKDHGKVQSVYKTISYVLANNGENETTTTEMLFTSFLVEHNISLGVSDHVGHLIPAMFPDTTVAKIYGCERTKTFALTKEEIPSVLQISAFSLSADGSTDKNVVKLYHVIVLFFNEKLGQVRTLLLLLFKCTDNKGEGIFSVTDKELVSRMSLDGFHFWNVLRGFWNSGIHCNSYFVNQTFDSLNPLLCSWVPHKSLTLTSRRGNTRNTIQTLLLAPIVEPFCDISLRTTSFYSSVQYFIERNQRLLDMLEQEFVLYQCESFSGDIISENRMDVSWCKISIIKNESGQPKFKALPKMMLALLTVTHSNFQQIEFSPVFAVIKNKF
ncbi:hypothetical protein PR048_001771 [Dryococelus australis]|uniref:Uncharacterized protein n=1 Tax=Dryococelus australis TaxID=614101 RepID=A0ABQ9IIE2_9NEOP|nr:hypothetical protein PR048_001771 [Dryococelus australis]